MTTTTEANWFPTRVLLPGNPRPQGIYRVVLGRGGEFDGVHVFSAPDRLVFHGYVNWARIGRLPTDAQLRNGFTVPLADGSELVVTRSGCQCGALKRWAGPEWTGLVSGR